MLLLASGLRLETPLERIAGVALLLGFMVAGHVWVRLGVARRQRLVPVLIAVLGGALAAALWVGRYPGWDDVQHLHTAWLMQHGQMPFRDFFENHSPLTYQILAALLWLRPQAVAICDFSRFLSLVLALASFGLTVALARRVLATRSVPMAALGVLWLGALLPYELYELRPDMFANVSSLGALLVLATSRRIRALVGSGLLLGLSVALTPKHAVLLAALPLALLLERPAMWPFVWRTGLHWIGIALGAAPTLAWLAGHGLLSDFRYWVFSFNQSIPRADALVLPLVLMGLVGAWLAVLWRERRGLRRLQPSESVAVAGMAAGMLMYRLQVIHAGPYGLQLCVLVLMGACCGEASRVMGWLVERRYGILAGFLLGFYFLPSVTVLRWVSHGDYFAGRAEIAALGQIAGGEAVVGVPPRHPVLAPDATRLSCCFVWMRWLVRDDVRAQLRGMAEQIEARRPALVMAGDRLTPEAPESAEELPFAARLVKTGNATPEEGERLQAFLQREYRLVRVVRHYYWVRNDKALPEGCEEVRG